MKTTKGKRGKMDDIDAAKARAGVPLGAGDDLAEAIRKISAGVAQLERSGLNRDAIVVLLAHHSKIPMTTCRAVIGSLGELARQYTR